MITREKLEHHIKHLQEQHDILDKDIADLYKNHADEYQIEKMKKQKLNLRDDIERLKQQIKNM